MTSQRLVKKPQLKPIADKKKLQRKRILTPEEKRKGETDELKAAVEEKQALLNDALLLLEQKQKSIESLERNSIMALQETESLWSELMETRARETSTRDALNTLQVKYVEMDLSSQVINQRCQDSCQEIQELRTELHMAISERDSAVEATVESDRRATVLQQANDAGQAVLIQAQAIEREKTYEMERRLKLLEDRSQHVQELEKLLGEEKQVVGSKAMLERSAFTGKEKLLRDRIEKLKHDLVAANEQIYLLKDKLSIPKPTFEQLKHEMTAVVRELLSALNERLTETEAFRGGESLRWKTIQCRVDVLTQNVERIFEILSASIYDKESTIRVLEQSLANSREEFFQTSERSSRVKHDTQMLNKLFHPITQLKKSVSKCVEKPVLMRARLLLSEIKKDSVTKLIEKHRIWDGTCSTLLMSCCIGCGAFFLEFDSAWPCNCVRENSLTKEHEEYAVFSSTEKMRSKIHQNLLDG